ncbi:hypothetical protein QKT49_gp370 [Acanthamoeba castellanii medusavirus]|uniref:Uncharacterized protein n=1 Tax=Acanthamoeba castellanii medusavirus J1 TaxID=3114988 RepID=A0A3T1CX32_9VIRU|nr:hypothetical protein QKT49_gp370 [Acanthamoeba castellanii medusavirus]BBI30393.1 hypothetical protein [Acanthamoeba castellanii medusavirus J1]
MADNTGGGLLGILMPQCNVPVHEMPTLEMAASCGRYSGYFWAAGLSVLALGLAAFYAWQVSKQGADYKPYISLTVAWLLAIAIAVLAWLLMPRITSYLHGQEWRGYRARLSSYEAAGYTPQQAMAQMETNDNIAQQIRSTNNIAAAIGGAGLLNSGLLSGGSGGASSMPPAGISTAVAQGA